MAVAKLPGNERGRVPLPKHLPGDFFVMEWNPARSAYIIHLDDEDGTSHDLGRVLPAIQAQLRLWGLEPRFANDCLDQCREFRQVQCIPAQRRVINLIPRQQVDATSRLFDQDRSSGYVQI